MADPIQILYPDQPVGDARVFAARQHDFTSLTAAALEYDDALRVFGLRCRSNDELVRNRAAGRVYESRKEFRRCVARIEIGEG